MENEERIPNEEEQQEQVEDSAEAQTDEAERQEPEVEPAPEPVDEEEIEEEVADEVEPDDDLSAAPEPAEEETPDGEGVEEEEEAETPPALPEEEPEKKPSFIKRVLHFLFSPETRVGRFMRPLLRTLALIVGMFAAGLLVAYFTLYTPLIKQRNQLTEQIQQLNQDLQDANTALDDQEAELADLQAASADSIETLEQELDLANFRIYFLIAKNDTLRARLALLDDEESPGGPAALAALNELEEHLKDLVPFVERDDPVLATLLQDRLKVVKGELVRDGAQAKIELESFYLDLLDLEDILFD